MIRQLGVPDPLRNRVQRTGIGISCGYLSDFVPEPTQRDRQKIEYLAANLA